MGGLVIHAVVYLSVNAMLVFTWLVTVGSSEQLEAVREDPTTVVENDFWPILVMVPWGVALIIHATAVLVAAMPGHRRRRRREHERRRQERRALGLPVPPSGPVPPVPPTARRRAERDQRAAAQREQERVQREAQGQPTPPASTAPQRRWTVVMFTDIARSTPLAETVGDEAWAALVAEHRATVRGVLASHEGHEVGTQGDGFLCRFGSPDDAVSAAVELQQTLAATRAQGGFAPEVRVGLHAGEAIDGHDDLLGNAVNLAARVMSVAEPGEILVTEPVADHLRPGLDLEDRGLFELKGITRARHLLAVRWDGSSPGGDEVVDLRGGGGDRGGQPRT